VVDLFELAHELVHLRELAVALAHALVRVDFVADQLDLLVHVAAGYLVVRYADVFLVVYHVCSSQFQFF